MASLAERLWAGGPSQLYVHCAGSVGYLAELKSSVPGLDCYPERALLLARPDDLVCVPNEVEPEYLDFLAGLGLGCDPANLIVASRFGGIAEGRSLFEMLLGSGDALDALGRRMRSQGTSALHPFMVSAGALELAELLSERVGFPIPVLGSDPDLTQYADCKPHIRAAAIELGVPVAPGELLDLDAAGQAGGRQQALVAAFRRQVVTTGRVIVRGGSGGAGSATFINSGDETGMGELARKIGQRQDNRFYLIEAMVESTASPNIQMHIDQAGTIECVGVSDQRLSPELIHRGNSYPSNARCRGDMIRWAGVLSKWLRDAGYAGIAGFDFVEYTDRQGMPRAFLAELNPRVNGATYPLAVLERVGGAEAFVSGVVRTEVESFFALAQLLKDLIFSPERGAGLLPYATGCLKYGRCPMVALASGRREAAELYAEAELILGELCVPA